jgi:hypothetical protein
MRFPIVTKRQLVEEFLEANAALDKLGVPRAESVAYTAQNCKTQLGRRIHELVCLFEEAMGLAPSDGTLAGADNLVERMATWRAHRRYWGEDHGGEPAPIPCAACGSQDTIPLVGGVRAYMNSAPNPRGLSVFCLDCGCLCQGSKSGPRLVNA